WLLALWKRTAAASGRDVEIRIAEHTVRAAYANTHHRARFFQGPRAGDRLAIISDTSHVVPWDGAGVLYMRHGPPDRRDYANEGAGEFQMWSYTQMEPPVNVLLGRVVAGDWGAVYVPPCVGNSFLGRFSPADADRRLLTGNNVTLRDIYY